MAIATINPATGKTEKTFDALGNEAIEAALALAEKAASVTRGYTIETRADWLRSAAAILRDEKTELGAMMTREMGKTHASAIAEAEKCAWVCEFYAENGPRFLADRAIETAALESFARWLPIGPVLAVMPWNFPFWQVFRFAAPAVLAGNVGLLKHASNVPQCALAIEDIFKRAGVPEGGFQTLLIGGDQVAKVLEDRRVRAATLTGSEGAGRAVAETAGRSLKKVVLELGGSDPFIVMPSADLDDAVSHAVKGRLLNNGQSCIAAKRFIVHADIYDTFRDSFAAALDAQTVGDPMADRTDIGPMATRDIRDELAQQVEDTLAAGATRIVGAELIAGDGFFYRPGLIENAPDGSPAASEELFGPVATLFKAASIDEAIEIANATRFGLGSAIFTQERGDMERAFNELDTGATFVNAITASDPRLPFGGVKASGHGRELAEDGIREFLNLKTCSIGASA
ncbi:MAG: NAD-dependent succinate-semialdehyde dehydrogenase [Pseudomonadota bacterium]